MSHYQAGLSNWSAYRKVPDEVWEKTMVEIDAKERSSKSHKEEIEELKQQKATLEEANREAYERMGMTPNALTRGTKREHLIKLLDALILYFGAEDRTEDEEDNDAGGEEMGDEDKMQDEEQEGAEETDGSMDTVARKRKSGRLHTGATKRAREE